MSSLNQQLELSIDTLSNCEDGEEVDVHILLRLLLDLRAQRVRQMKRQSTSDKACFKAQQACKRVADKLLLQWPNEGDEVFKASTGFVMDLVQELQGVSK